MRPLGGKKARTHCKKRPKGRGIKFGKHRTREERKLGKNHLPYNVKKWEGEYTIEKKEGCNETGKPTKNNGGKQQKGGVAKSISARDRARKYKISTQVWTTFKKKKAREATRRGGGG